MRILSIEFKAGEQNAGEIPFYFNLCCLCFSSIISSFFLFLFVFSFIFPSFSVCLRFLCSCLILFFLYNSFLFACNLLAFFLFLFIYVFLSFFCQSIFILSFSVRSQHFCLLIRAGLFCPRLNLFLLRDF